MKVLFLFTLLTVACVALSPQVSVIPGDNSQYVEGESRYIWMTGDDNIPYLVDLEESVDEQILRRSGANNQYWLFTRRNPTFAQILIHGNINSLDNSNYNPNAPTNFVAHGWNGNGNSRVNTDIRDAFLANSDCNVIVVDWRSVANSGYITAISGVPNVGQHIGDFISWVIATRGGNWNNVHLVGYSLGAHVVGNAGKRTEGRISRITGLDPAGPLWHTNSNSMRSSDGQYVEAIHTDGGVAGIMSPIATADFYPNGGRNQPGCITNGCSHGRAVQFFASSVRHNHFVGRRCSNFQEAMQVQCSGTPLNMGNAILTKRGEGLFGLRTGAGQPF